MKNTPEYVELEFELQGFDQEDIETKLTKDSLVIKTNKKSMNKNQEKDFFHVEKSARKFNYKTSLPDINPKKSTIGYKKGLLRIKALKLKNKKK